MIDEHAKFDYNIITRNNDSLTKYINDKIIEKSKRAKELLQQQETEQNEREYQEFIRLKQKFEGA